MKLFNNGGLTMKLIKKRFLTLCLCLSLCLGMSLTAHAATAYRNYHVTNTRGSFQIDTRNFSNSSILKYSAESQGFSSNSYISVSIWNANGTSQLSEAGILLSGSQKIENQNLRMYYPAGIYTVKYVVSGEASTGWLGVWLY